MHEPAEGVGPSALLEIDGVSKRYGALLANDRISFGVAQGEVVGVLGENGAGKSTLMNIVSGLIQPDEGVVRLAGREVAFASPRDAAEAGIGMVHQHFKLVGAMTVAENLALGDPNRGRGLLHLDRLAREMRETVERLGVQLDFEARVDSLTVGQQQRVEILKVLSRRPRVLILDEPTAVLTREERPALFRLIAELAAQGAAVILISHKLEDIVESCQRVVVLRQGRVVSVSQVDGKRREDLVRLLVGDDLPALAKREPTSCAHDRLLDVRGLSLCRPDGTRALDDVSFCLHAGEILALCGVDGNGQSELMHVLAGLVRPATGSMRYWFDSGSGVPDAASIRRGGVCHIPEDRLRDGVMADASLMDNYLLTQLDDGRLNRRGWLRRSALRRATVEAVAAYAIRAPGVDAALSQLSGGNQQKLVLARELARDPRVVLAAHPTRGLDVQTIAFVNNQLLACRQRGAGVLLASADLSEAWQVADRIMVMAAGRLHGPVPLALTSLYEVGRWMTNR